GCDGACTHRTDDRHQGRRGSRVGIDDVGSGGHRRRRPAGAPGRPDDGGRLTMETLGQVLVIVPTYNERENLPLITERLRAALPDAHLLVADDNSPDGTGKIADELAAADDHVHVLHRPAKQGLGAAYIAGFEWGLGEGYDVLVEMDADGSHQPEELHKLLASLADGADLAIGSRYVPGGRVKN